MNKLSARFCQINQHNQIKGERKNGNRLYKCPECEKKEFKMIMNKPKKGYGYVECTYCKLLIIKRMKNPDITPKDWYKSLVNASEKGQLRNMQVSQEVRIKFGSNSREQEMNIMNNQGSNQRSIMNQQSSKTNSDTQLINKIPNEINKCGKNNEQQIDSSGDNYMRSTQDVTPTYSQINQQEFELTMNENLLPIIDEEAKIQRENYHDVIKRYQVFDYTQVHDLEKLTHETSEIQDRQQRKFGMRNQFPWTFDAYRILKEEFGLQEFRPNQLEIINASMSNRDVFALMPCSGGKSLPFQIMSKLKPGVTIVIMPLISLIQDQYNQMISKGLRVLQLHSGLRCSSDQIIQMNDFDRQQEMKRQRAREQQDYIDIANGKYDLIYICPERLGIQEPIDSSIERDYVSDQEVSNFMKVLENLSNKNMLNRIVFDEVHCVAKWGETFRKAYSSNRLSQLKAKFQNVPLLALTATITVETRVNLVQNLKYNEDFCLFVSPFNRPNLNFQVRETKWGHDKQIIQDIKNNYRNNEQGIIYCRTRMRCEQLSDALQKAGINSKYYHSKLRAEVRSELQHHWMKDNIRVIVSTTALGMGINKQNIRFVYHDQMPTCLEQYINESGRAGRDGMPADCVVYHSDKKDISQWAHMLNYNHNIFGVSNEHRENEFKNLVIMDQYCQNKSTCRKKMMIEYLGEHFDTRNCNNGCDVCKNAEVHM